MAKHVKNATIISIILLIPYFFNSLPRDSDARYSHASVFVRYCIEKTRNCAYDSADQ